MGNRPKHGPNPPRLVNDRVRVISQVMVTPRRRFRSVWALRCLLHAPMIPIMPLRLLATLAAALLVACSHNPATGRRQLLLMSPAQEVAIGKKARGPLIKHYGGEVQSQQVRNYVKRVGDSLLPGIEGQYRNLPWSFTALKSDEINAFSLPGGQVFITKGLLQKLRSEAELAAVLGHEIGHVTAQHHDERLSHANVINTTAAVLAQGSGNAPTISQIVNAAGGGYLLRFSRDQEMEADDLGVRYIGAAGYWTPTMILILRVLDEGPHSPEVFSTHPLPKSRIDRLEGIVPIPENRPQDAQYRKAVLDQLN